MKKNILTAGSLLLLMTLLTGLLYPLAVTGLAALLFPRQAAGCLLSFKGQPVGSALIGQNFKNPAFFHGRPSAAGREGYDGTSSSGSNLGPTNRNLIDTIRKAAEALRVENALSADAPVPSDLVTASGSGLDPDITPESAFLQVSRVARSRQLPEEQVREFVLKAIRRPQLGILGERRVNVLELNLELEKYSIIHIRGTLNESQ
ncbi:MAG: potassium-transporting ATPase subunit KdpC [bacterium]